MKITDIKLTNFRSHKKASFTFDSNITLIEGPNGIGKTNILEAIYVLSTGKSPRAKYDKDLIEYNSGFATLAAHAETKDDSLMLDMQIIKSEAFENASTKKVKVNKVPKTIAYFCGVFNSVLFTPEDIQLITGSPSERRRYLDSVLVQTGPAADTALHGPDLDPRQQGIGKQDACPHHSHPLCCIPVKPTTHNPS